MAYCCFSFTIFVETDSKSKPRCNHGSAAASYLCENSEIIETARVSSSAGSEIPSQRNEFSASETARGSKTTISHEQIFVMLFSCEKMVQSLNVPRNLRLDIHDRSHYSSSSPADGNEQGTKLPCDPDSVGCAINNGSKDAFSPPTSVDVPRLQVPVASSARKSGERFCSRIRPHLLPEI